MHYYHSVTAYTNKHSLLAFKFHRTAFAERIVENKRSLKSKMCLSSLYYSIKPNPYLYSFGYTQ